MPFFRWIDAYHVGVPAIDTEHMQLVTMMNELYEGMLSGNADVIIDTVFDELVAYGENHMRKEEALFADISFPNAAWHTRQHDTFRKHIRELRDTATAANGKALALETLSYLKGWLTRHIEKADREYVDYMRESGKGQQHPLLRRGSSRTQ